MCVTVLREVVWTEPWPSARDSPKSATCSRKAGGLEHSSEEGYRWQWQSAEAEQFQALELQVPWCWQMQWHRQMHI